MIKKIILTMMLLSTILFADMNWILDLDDAYDNAEQDNKIIMVMISQEGCPGCQYMENIVLKADNVTKTFNKNFIAVHLDIHHDTVPIKLEHFVTPTFYFLNADEEILGVFYGSKNEMELLGELKKILK